MLPFVVSLVAGAATGLGAVPAAFVQRATPGLRRTVAWAGAGLMIVAALFTLLLPAIGLAAKLDDGTVLVVGGLALGLMAVGALERLEHRLRPSARDRRGAARVLPTPLLLALAIALHNVPEGLAVGSGFASGDLHLGASVAVGIGLQNLPEGFLVAFGLVEGGVRRGLALLVALSTGLVEPVASLAGISLGAHATEVLPFILSAAAGAMLAASSGAVVEGARALYARMVAGASTPVSA